MPEANDELIFHSPSVKMTPEELKEARHKFEAGQTTRRAALRKIGITAGAAFFAMFAVDDLARLAGKRLKQMRSDNQIADDLAKELRSIGVAFADGGTSGGPGPCATGTNKASCDACNQSKSTTCSDKATSKHDSDLCDACFGNASAACGNGPDWPGFSADWQPCLSIINRP